MSNKIQRRQQCFFDVLCDRTHRTTEQIYISAPGLQFILNICVWSLDMIKFISIGSSVGSIFLASIVMPVRISKPQHNNATATYRLFIVRGNLELTDSPSKYKTLLMTTDDEFFFRSRVENIRWKSLLKSQENKKVRNMCVLNTYRI